MISNKKTILKIFLLSIMVYLIFLSITIYYIKIAGNIPIFIIGGTIYIIGILIGRKNKK